jgi:hypothetical protein
MKFLLLKNNVNHMSMTLWIVPACMKEELSALNSHSGLSTDNDKIEESSKDLRIGNGYI